MLDAESIVLLPAPRKIERLHGYSQGPLETHIDPHLSAPQGYRLSIAPRGSRIVGHDAAGGFYGRQTLTQLRRQFPESLPCLEIED